MAINVTLPNVFATQTTGNVPASYLDADFNAIVTALKDPVAFVNAASDSGAANAYVVNPSPAWTAYSLFQEATWKVANANTGASTINVSGLGLVNLVDGNGLALPAGYLTAGSIIKSVFDGSQMRAYNYPGAFKAPSSGYTRVIPGFNRISGGATDVALVRDTNTTVSVSGLTNATAVLVRLFALAQANNGVAQRFTSVVYYTDSSFTVIVSGISAFAYEFSALAATTIIGSNSETFLVPVSSGSIYLKMTDDAGNQGSGGYTILGYLNS